MDTNEVSGEKEIKGRGFWLSAFLILMIIVNSATVFTYIVHSEFIIQEIPKLTTGILYFVAALAFANVVLAIGIWNWKKWGVYGFCGVATTVFFINLYVGIGISGSFMGLMSTVIIYLLTKSRWGKFS